MDHQTSRRFFLHKAATSIGLALSAPAIVALISACERDEVTPKIPVGKTVEVDISTIPELSSAGSITLTFVDELNGGSPVFISRVAQNSFVVFTSVCTHAGCEVGVPDPPVTSSNCICPCHGAEYSASTGSVVRQPSNGRATDLHRFSTAFNASSNILTITA
ncbi:MAG: Rieske 2Fe-2S domain-containing protein [Candidatus Kapabacteria bacterium]|nr:Rieske 2Fe-2S domain-containing protein [Candidatus Kapabacteria bacterium]